MCSYEELLNAESFQGACECLRKEAISYSRVVNKCEDSRIKNHVVVVRNTRNIINKTVNTCICYKESN